MQHPQLEIIDATGLVYKTKHIAAVTTKLPAARQAEGDTHVLPTCKPTFSHVRSLFSFFFHI